MNTEEFGSLKLLKLKCRRKDQIIQLPCRIGSPQEIRSPLSKLWKFRKSEKSTPESCRMHWNLTNDEEFGSSKLLKLKYRSGVQIIQPFCRIGSHQEIRSLLFNLWKFQKSEENNPESCGMQWSLKNGEESGSLKLLQLKKWSEVPNKSAGN